MHSPFCYKRAAAEEVPELKRKWDKLFLVRIPSPSNFYSCFIVIPELEARERGNGGQDTLYVTLGFKGAYIIITNDLLNVIASGDQRYHPYGEKHRRKSKVCNCNNYVLLEVIITH